MQTLLPREGDAPRPAPEEPRYSQQQWLEREAEFTTTLNQLRQELEALRQMAAPTPRLAPVRAGLRTAGEWLLAPWRWACRLLGPHVADLRSLVRQQNLERVAGVAGSWRATGPNPQFLLPCEFPAGWLRLRYRLRSEVNGWLEIYADTGRGFQAEEVLELARIGCLLERECYVWLPRPVRALRLDPLDREGPFILDEFEARSVSSTVAFCRAIAGKLRLLREAGCTLPTLGRGLKLLVRGRVGTFVRNVFKGVNGPLREAPEPVRTETPYDRWRRRHALTQGARQRLLAEAAILSDPPLLSVLLPVFDPPEPFLHSALASVRKQLYPHWELCIADASKDPAIRTILEEYAGLDPRIRVVRCREEDRTPAVNTALGLARGSHLALLDPCDELAEQALFRMVQVLQLDPEADLVYSDEDRFDADGQHVEPFFKPDWSPDYFLGCPYTGHLSAYRTALVRELGGFRGPHGLAGNCDLALRIAARSQRIRHVPDVLYHRRTELGTRSSERGASGVPSSELRAPSSEEAVREVLQRHLAATGRHGTVEPGPAPGLHRVRFPVTGQPRVSIVIPAGCKRSSGCNGSTAVERCIVSVRRLSTFPVHEILVVVHEPAAPELRQRLEDWEVRLLTCSSELSLAARMNRGAATATGDYLVFLNEHVEVLTPDWLEALLGFGQFPEIGAVGAKLHFPDGRIQQAGVTLLDALPTLAYHGSPGDHPGWFGGNLVPRNCSAVSGDCLLTRAELFRELGGFNAADFPQVYSDVDYCLRLVRQGKRIVSTPDARLCHHEPVAPDDFFPAEMEAFHRLWGATCARDPWYNPNLSTRYPDWRIAAE
jgi:GT2 family glycosyltransferase